MKVNIFMVGIFLFFIATSSVLAEYKKCEKRYRSLPKVSTIPLSELIEDEENLMYLIEDTRFKSKNLHKGTPINSNI